MQTGLGGRPLGKDSGSCTCYPPLAWARAKACLRTNTAQSITESEYTHGYAHNWNRTQIIEPAAFNIICKDFLTLYPRSKQPALRLPTPMGTKSRRSGRSSSASTACLLRPRQESESPGSWPAKNAHGIGDNARLGGTLPYRTCNGDCSYESVWFERCQKAAVMDGMAGGFCKTAFRPYDLAVTAFLMIVKHHLGSEVQVQTDGAPCQRSKRLHLASPSWATVPGTAFRTTSSKSLGGGTVRMTYRIAHTLGWDAADRQMQSAGCNAWNEDDAELAAATLNRHLPHCAELPDIDPVLCGCGACGPQAKTPVQGDLWVLGSVP